MRHNKKFNHLGRKASHRNAMLANMAVSLIEHKRINTTLAKAKELRKYVEPLITKAKEDTTHSRRVVFSYLQNKNAITTLFGEISQRVGELVDYNENLMKDTSAKKKAKTRRSGKKAVKAETVVAEEASSAVEPQDAETAAPAAEDNAKEDGKE